ncbi:MAG TPA: sugar transferase [Negativicutes bacterium]|nr:sugar transferase [Negativicutes bacterium]
MAKRIFDIIFASLGALMLAPVLITIAVAIKLTSPGPVFYRGVRTGLHGKPFRIFKFRTMVVNAEKVGGPSTGKDDPRITSVGGFLRRYKLDELPQLLNVISGEMSLVGPRPEVPQYTAEYQGEELLILTVRPGITDYASIKFSRLDEVLGSEEPDRVYEEKVRPVKNALRIKYVKEQSFFGDIALIFSTIFRICRG